MNLSDLKPSVTTLEIDRERHEVTFKAGEQRVTLKVDENNRMTPTDRAFLKLDATNPDSLGLRFVISAVITHLMAWLHEPNEENEKELVEVHEAFNKSLESAPEATMLMALEHGLDVLRTLISAKQQRSSTDCDLELLPTQVELGVEENGKRTVKISCEDAFVVLAQVDTGKPNTLALDALHEQGDENSDQALNLKVTFMAVRDAAKDYLLGPDDLIEYHGQALLAAADGWNQLKVERPDMARSLVSAFLRGEGSIKVAVTRVSEEEAEAILERYEKGEITFAQMRAALDESDRDVTLH